MKRSDFLKAAGAIGAASILPLKKAKAGISELEKQEGLQSGTCVLIPSETRGPYPLNLSSNASMFRQTINETKTGLPLRVTFNIVNINDNCNPLQNIRVDVWHCDKDGVYSGFNQPGANTVGQTFCRGIQLTDSNGQVQFITVYPGWYGGRITHIHFEMYLNSVLKATSQLAFPDALNTAVYNTPLYITRGQNTSVANNAADMVFKAPAGSLQYQVASMTENSGTGGYDAVLNVGISVPVTGLIQLETETGGQFKLYNNYPNPFSDITTIPFTLTYASNVKIEIFDLEGRKVTDLVDRKMSAGEQRVVLDRNAAMIPLAAGNYIYQLSVSNSNGTFKQCKLFTAK